MYSIPTDNLSFRKGCNSNAKRFCCSPKQRTFKRDAYTATYDLDNKLQTFGNKTITYDNDGNMTSGPIIEGGNNAALEFNARGQLMGTGDVAYAYDLENTRTIVMHYDKNKILTQYRYVYNRVGNVPEVLMRVKLTNMTSQSTYYVYGAGLAYEVKITPDGQEAVRYYHYDQVGSTVAMTDSAQAITDRFHYDPWGYVLHSIGDSDTPFQFVGAYGIQTDPNGLINMRARYYNPVTKSFISQDPSGFNGGLNWYLYANGNPFSFIDISGLVTIYVHGTWSSGEEAFPEDFRKTVNKYFVDSNEIIFNWSGKNRDSARKSAGAQLAQVINSYSQNHPYESINIVAHSHGGNVALIASNKASINNLVTLGTPIQSSYNRGSNLTKWINIYSTGDRVQTLPWGAKRTSPNADINIGLTKFGHSDLHTTNAWNSAFKPISTFK